MPGRLCQALRPGDGALDIGANVGEHARQYAEKVGPTGHVVAVEPDPETAQKCREQSSMYPWLKVLEVAVTAIGEGPVTLFRDQDRRRNSLWQDNILEAGDDSVTVWTVTLDQLADLVPKLRAIKIDAQGAEAQILQGGWRTLRNPGLTWYVELWTEGLQHAGSSAETVIGMFEETGWLPVNSTWDQVRRGAQGQSGHGSMDIHLTHRERSA